MTAVPAFIGVGANLGDARATVMAAIDDCRAIERSRLTAASSMYRSAPVEASGPDYVNAVLAVETRLPAHELLRVLQQIENRHGRLRPHHHAPRSLDLDLLLYGGQIVDQPGLSVPHPRMHQRAFVLLPLLEIAPQVDIPGRGLARQWLGSVADQSIERIVA